jgi:serine O-acetyltransferase
VWLRLSSKAKNPIVRRIARRLFVGMSKKYGLQIPPSVEIGYGLYIGHGLCVVMHAKTVIGDNCNLSQFTTIGSNRDTPARIGNNVYIGPNVCIVEDVTIGDNAIIGAGAVVVKDVPANCTVAGNPARIISQKRRDVDAPNLWKCEV